MITASVVLYHSKESDVKRIIECTLSSSINLLFVVDNSETDRLRSIVDGYNDERLFYLHGHGNVGYGDGNNLGISEALKMSPAYHVILNPDIIFEKGVIDSLTSFMDCHQDVGMCTPSLVFTDGSFQASGMLLPTPIDIFVRRLLPSKYADIINKEYELRAYDLNVARNVPNICGCFFFMRVSTLKEVGLFDSRYFMYFEDFDLVRRFHKISKTAYCPTAKVVHAHGNEHRTNKKLFFISIKAAIKYFNKWGWIFDADRRRWNKEARTDNAIIR